MKIKAIIYSHNDPYEGITAQQVEIKNKEKFNCCNLDECPEDAIIGRDLFDANDYLDAVEFGMKLAKQGYDSIEVEEKEDDE
ncbi:protein of unknown function [Ruminococcaceae bacterium BL-6]|nr:protein of unknown function [Ruminococcaceae bacterium BL-6]